MAKQYAAKRAKLKAMADDDTLPPEERFDARAQARQAAAQLVADARPQSLRDDGRVRAAIRKFKLSRLALRELASSGRCPAS